MEKIWLSSYPAGVPADIDVGALGSLVDLLEQGVARHGPKTAFVSGATGVSVRYDRLDTLSRQVAAYFQSVLQLPRGSRVALMMPNLLQYPVCLFGLLRAGYVVVNVNPMYTARELEHQLKDAEAEAMVVVDLFAHTLARVIANTPVRHVVVTGVADLMPPLQRRIGNFVARHVKRVVPPYRLPGSVAFTAVLAGGAAAPFARVPVAPDDLAFLQYTGGTTGGAKGAMLSHRNVMANVAQGRAWIDPFLDLEERLVCITAIPLYHVFALGICLNFFGLGGSNVLVADPRNLKGFVKILARHRFTSIPAVNTLFNGLLHEPGFEALDFSGLRFALGGGAAVQRPVAERWQRITGAPLLEGYGLTECSPTVTCTPLDRQAFDGSIGLPMPSTEVSIRDAEGRELPVGAAGELCVRGPQVMRGYWRRPEDTAKVLGPDGFLRTGDVAVMDEHGFLRIVDRLKDMILVSGFNVYPNEIEEVAMLHPEVLEAAAVGAPSENSGEAVRLYVVRKSPRLDEAALRAHCREHLTAYKRPQRIEFLDSLPKSNVGKILRRELRDRA